MGIENTSSKFDKNGLYFLFQVNTQKLIASPTQAQIITGVLSASQQFMREQEVGSNYNAFHYNTCKLRSFKPT